MSDLLQSLKTQIKSWTEIRKCSLLNRTVSVPCDRTRGSAQVIRLAYGVVGTIWLDLGALNQDYFWITQVKHGPPSIIS